MWIYSFIVTKGLLCAMDCDRVRGWNEDYDTVFVLKDLSVSQATSTRHQVIMRELWVLG